MIVVWHRQPTIITLDILAKHQVVAYTQKSQIKHENRHIQLVREYGFHPRTKATVEDGDVLPKKFEPFPENMYGKPLEEIDTFIYEEVLRKREMKLYSERMKLIQIPAVFRTSTG
uniref:Uncharacterized protein n=1 Tax=Glossina palpalis gambiensis TaxID=67801 RepID=A0A1B0BZ41_9MUSC